MSKEFDYTSRARQFAGRYPIFSFVLIQIFFWVIANILLAILIYLQTLSISQQYSLEHSDFLLPMILLALVMGILYGIVQGAVDYNLDRQFFKRKPLGKVLIFKTFISLVTLIVLLTFVRFILVDLFIVPQFFNGDSGFTDESWRYLFYQFIIYYFFMTLIISFINEVNKKFGPGVLLPVLLGKYRNPRVEERIFLFMDLKSSTTIAESLGYMKYSSFIRDSFMDINHLLTDFNAEIYQYVGDEIVVSWKINEGLENLSCINFFFACEKQFEVNRDYYLKNYNQLPEFKAGLHMGKVSAVEIGKVKVDIAYHGDTINVAARIQSKCNEYSQKFLVSEYFIQNSETANHFRTKTLGNIILKGKTIPVGISSIEIF